MAGASSGVDVGRRVTANLLSDLDYSGVTSRKLDAETCDKFGYGKTTFDGKPAQVANYRSTTGELVAQKVRFANKEFTVLGELKEAALFGQHLWRDGGQKLVVTEGEIDALSVSQVQGNKWPVVSIPTGAAGGAKACKANLEFLLKFESVIFMFDMDEPGREAARECAALLPPGKAKIATLSMKDPNELLKAGKGKEIIDAIWGAKDYRPDGLVSVADVLADALAEPEEGLPWFLPTLTKLTYGRRPGEVYTFGAGTGVGKTDLFTQQIVYDIEELKQTVGIVFLEQPPGQSVKRLAGKAMGKRFHIPAWDAGWTQGELVEGVKRLDGKLIMYDNFGSTDWEVIKNLIRFMVHAHGIKLIYLDHLTALADEGDGERGSLEKITKEIAMLGQETKAIIHMISHLATPEGKPHEEGGRVTIRHFKGSRAIGFWSYFMFGMERDQHAEDQAVRKTTTFRVLKDRNTGNSTGAVIYLGYDIDTGRLYETDAPTKNTFKDESATPPEDY